MKLDCLPTELLIGIAEYIYFSRTNIQPSCSRSGSSGSLSSSSNGIATATTLDFRDSFQVRSTTDLASFALTNRRIYHVIAALLWECVHLERPPIPNQVESLTKCDINSHRRWQFGLSTGAARRSRVPGPARRIDDRNLSANVLRHIKIFSACKFSHVAYSPTIIDDGVEVKAKAQGAGPTLAPARPQGGLKLYTPTWINLLTPEVMPNLQRLELCLNPNNHYHIEKHAKTLKTALLGKYAPKDPYCPHRSTVRLVLKVRLSQATTALLLNELGSEVLALVQSLVLANHTSTMRSSFHKNVYSIVQHMEFLEHLCFEHWAEEKTPQEGHYVLASTGLDLEVVDPSTIVYETKLMETIAGLKHLKQLEMPNWTDFKAVIPTRLFTNNHFTELMCDANHFHDILLNQIQGINSIKEYPMYDSLDSLEIFIPNRRVASQLENILSTNPPTLPFKNLRRLLCFSKYRHCKLASMLIRRAAKSLCVLRVNEPELDDLAYLLGASQDTLQMLYVDSLYGTSRSYPPYDFFEEDQEILTESGLIEDHGSDDDESTLNTTLNQYRNNELARLFAESIFHQNLTNVFSLFKDQRRLQRLVLPVVKSCSSIGLILKYITQGTPLLSDVWFACNEPVATAFVLLCSEDETVQQDDFTHTAVELFSGPGRGGGAYRALQEQLCSHLSHRYVKPVHNTAKKIRHIGGEYKPSEYLYRCDLQKWRRDLDDDYAKKEMKEMTKRMIETKK